MTAKITHPIRLGIALATFAMLATSEAISATPSDALIDALIRVESNGNDNAVGDGGNAIGCLQIWPAVVADVNRILGTTYTHADCYDRATSIAICRAYIAHYTQADASDETMARVWNGGPRGARKRATLAYWSKVKQALGR